MANLQKVAILAGTFGELSAFQVSYFRNEFDGVWRIGQTNVAHARETRLYVYAARIGTTFYTLTMGDKDTQQADLARAAEIVAAIKKDN